jgi:hypothetical protein
MRSLLVSVGMSVSFEGLTLTSIPLHAGTSELLPTSGLLKADVTSVVTNTAE